MDTLSSFVDDFNLNDDQLDEEEVLIPKYRALYLDQLTKISQSLHVERDVSFKSMVREFKQVEDADFTVPVNLQKTLRRYQKTGYRWLKTLSKYQMGGILCQQQ